MSRYRLAASAQLDLRDIQTEMLKAGGTRLARYIRAEITRNMLLLADNPKIGHARADLTDEPVKFWAVFSYLIVYDPAMVPLGIARIVHGARDLEKLFERQPPKA